MATIESQGTVFQVGDAASPEVFNAVSQVTSITAVRSGQATEISITDMSSSAQEFKIGLKDEGSIQVALNYDPDDTDGQGRLETLRDNRNAGNFKIILNDGSPGTTYEFAGYVTSFPFDANTDDVLRSTVSIRVSGAMVKT